MIQVIDNHIDLNIYMTSLLIGYKELDLIVWNMKYKKNNRMWEWVIYKKFLLHSFMFYVWKNLYGCSVFWKIGDRCRKNYINLEQSDASFFTINFGPKIYLILLLFSQLSFKELEKCPWKSWNVLDFNFWIYVVTMVFLPDIWFLICKFLICKFKIQWYLHELADNWQGFF